MPGEERFDNNNDSINPLSSSVRLIGVGRAVLRKLFYQTPSELNIERTDHVDEVCTVDEFNDDDPDDENEVDVDINFTYGGYEDGTPIVMSRFEPLVDDSTIYSSNDPNKVGEKGQRSHRSSPVHGKG